LKQEKCQIADEAWSALCTGVRAKRNGLSRAMRDRPFCQLAL
jgi:hypothetical protein